MRLARPLVAGVRAREELERADAGEAALTPGRRRRAAVTTGRRRKREETARDGPAAEDHMVRADLRLVVSGEKRHAHCGLPLPARLPGAHREHQ